MTLEPEPSPDDQLRDQARQDVQLPPAPVPGAQHLPDDVPEGRIEDEGDEEGADDGQV